MKITLIILLTAFILLSGCTKEKSDDCTDSNEMCLNKPNGTSCSTGIWCDEQGRVCGGQSCVGMGLGKCQSEECVPS